jgi:hypothetical protein
MAPGGAVRAAAAAAAAKNKQTDRIVRIEENVPAESCHANLLFRMCSVPAAAAFEAEGGGGGGGGGGEGEGGGVMMTLNLLRMPQPPRHEGCSLGGH